jgi:hypothetical protein
MRVSIPWESGKPQGDHTGHRAGRRGRVIPGESLGQGWAVTRESVRVIPWESVDSRVGEWRDRRSRGGGWDSLGISGSTFGLTEGVRSDLVDGDCTESIAGLTRRLR